LNTLVKGIDIYNKRMETIKNYNKLQEIEMQNEVENYILNKKIKKCYVQFCAFEYYENNKKIIKYNLNEIPIKGKILIIGNQSEPTYVSKCLQSPTWLELCKIANDQIITNSPDSFKYLYNISVMKTLGDIKICSFGMAKLRI